MTDLVSLHNGIYTWDLANDVHGFWDRYLDGIASKPRDTTPRDIVRRAHKESRDYCVNFGELLENRMNLYCW